MNSIQQIVQAIGHLDTKEKKKLWELLVEEGYLSERYQAAAPAGQQLDLLPSSPASHRSPDYILTFDGGSKGNPGWGYGSYAITRVQDGSQLIERLDLGDNYTNNEAEYDTLIAGLEDLIQRIERAREQPQAYSLEVRGDSTLVLNQVQGKWQAKDPRMRERRGRSLRLLRRFDSVDLKIQPREESVRVLGH
jgi:ribonuclease HI